MLPEDTTKVLLLTTDAGAASVLRADMDHDDMPFSFHWTTVDTLAQALEELRLRPPQLVLLDGSGDEDAMLSVREAAPNIPVVLLANHLDIEDALAGLRAGAEDVVLLGEDDAWGINRRLRFAVERSRAAVAEEPIRRSLGHRASAEPSRVAPTLEAHRPVA
jgi:DNA-binding response OmpR family regulator